LGVIEEFTPGSGTYAYNGAIRSKLTGCTLLDFRNKKVSVYPLVQSANVPEIGSIVFGRIVDVKSKRAILQISQIGERKLSGFLRSILHIADTSPRYVESMFSAYKLGDFVKAKVISDKSRTLYLSTADINLGVVSAMCSRCGYLLQPKGPRMHCSGCGNVELRKVASDYKTGKPQGEKNREDKHER
jgi:exosome complex component CSL4